MISWKKHSNTQVRSKSYLAVLIVSICFQLYGSTAEETLSLDLNQREWIKQHPELIAGVLRDSQPLSFVDSVDGSQGIMIDYLNLVSDRIGLNIELRHLPFSEILDGAKDGEIDLFPAIETGERKNHFDFSDAFFNISGVIYTDMSVSYIDGVSWLSSQQVAVIEETNYDIFMRENFPETEVILCGSAEEALKKVLDGEADAFVGDRYTGSQIIARKYRDELKIAGSAGIPSEKLRFAVRKDHPQLVNLLNEAIADITQKEHDDILHRWTTVRYEHQVNLTFLWLIVIGAAIIVGSLFVWNWQLARSVAAKTAQLERSNRDLVESEAQYRVLVENTHDIVHAVDLDGKLEYFSPQALRYGIDPKKVISKSFFDLIATDDRERVATCFQKTINTGEELPIEFRIVDSEGNLKWFEGQGNVVLNDSGQPIGTTGVLRDITKRKGDELLWSSQSRLIEIAENSSLSEFLKQVIEELKEITTSEKSFFQIIEKYANLPVAFSEAGLSDFGGCMLLDENAEEADRIEIIQKCIDEQTPVMCNDCGHQYNEYTGQDNGSPLRRGIAVPVVRNEKVVALVGVANKKAPFDDYDQDLVQRLAEVAWEILERKQTYAALKKSEEDLNLAQSIARVGSYSWDVFGNDSSWSVETARILGFEDAEPCYDLLLSVVHPDDKDDVIRSGEVVMQGGNKIDMEYRIVRPDGAVRWIQSIAEMSTINPDGTPGPILGTIQDITERKEAEIQLQKTLAELKRWHDLVIGREDRIQSLKLEVNELLERLDEKPRYSGKYYDSSSDL